MHRSVLVALSAISVAPAAAVAGPLFSSSVGQPGDVIQPLSPDVLEARFRADTTNWDMRLENNGSPAPGENQLNLANGLGAFRDRTFDFSLSYSSELDRVAWTVSRSSGLTGSLFFDAAELASFNTVKFATGASRSSATVSDLSFSGLGHSLDAWPSLSASSSGNSYAETYLFFGNSADLFAGDWTLSGKVRFGDFTHNNPSEGAKVTLKLYQAAEIPSPGGIAALGLAAGFCMARRRRA